ncbi:hypothetical protein BGZ63DRAFT_427500 [Mariannaea sp. PMI_226]|nr:hypothetical protein BGZ63DRAFT_427500 [Mariannaea sp. PMI_226]
MVGSTTSIEASAVTATRNPFDIPGRMPVKIVIAGLFSLCFLTFFLIIGIDMVRKHRTGELQESMRNLSYLSVKIPKVLFQLLIEGICFVWVWFTDLFRSEENKRRKKQGDPETALARRDDDSSAIIERLAAKPRSVTESSTDEGIQDTAPATSFKGKEVPDIMTTVSAGVSTAFTERAKEWEQAASPMVAAKGKKAETSNLPDREGSPNRATKEYDYYTENNERMKKYGEDMIALALSVNNSWQSSFYYQ